MRRARGATEGCVGAMGQDTIVINQQMEETQANARVSFTQCCTAGRQEAPRVSGLAASTS